MNQILTSLTIKDTPYYIRKILTKVAKPREIFTNPIKILRDLSYIF